MDFFKAIKVKAFRDVLFSNSDKHPPNPDYNLRFIFRWYSKTFHTPLHEVDALPLEGVIRAFFEEKYEGMDEDDREEEIRALTESEEERGQRLTQEEQQKFTDKVFQEAIEKREAGKLEAKPGSAPIKEIPKTSRGLSEVNLPQAKAEQPVIKMTFMSDAELDALIDGHGGITQPDKK